MVRRRNGVRRPPRGGIPIDKSERRKLATQVEPKREDQMRCYAKRDKHLSELGYASYDIYLSSDDWKGIRAKKLRHHKHCVLCDAIATQVHHLSYAPEVLLGLRHSLLVTVCDKCHIFIEFNGDRKRTLEEANTFLIDKARDIGKISWVRMVKKVMRHYCSRNGEMK